MRKVERVGAMIYDALVRKDEHFNLQPWLATSWERPDALDVGVPSSRRRALSRWQADDRRRCGMVDAQHDGRNLVTAKGGAFAAVQSVDVRDPLTVVVHMKQADNALLFNLSDGLFGVVERGAGKRRGAASGGHRAIQVCEPDAGQRSRGRAQRELLGGAPKIERIRFAVAPDTITAALELKKGSGDVESNVMTYDMVHALRSLRNLRTETGPGSIVIYANFNVTDPALRDKRVRQAIACAIDKPALIDALWRGEATAASSLCLPDIGRPRTMATCRSIRMTWRALCDCWMKQA